MSTEIEQLRSYQIDQTNKVTVFIHRILEALGCGKCCTGIDPDSDHHSETTHVILEEIEKLKFKCARLEGVIENIVWVLNGDLTEEALKNLKAYVLRHHQANAINRFQEEVGS